ncbi:MAG: S41 family peptidase [Gemmatimonadaceae bacterium]
MRSRSAAAITIFVAALGSGGWLLARGLSAPIEVEPSASLVDDVLSKIRRYYIDSLASGDLYERAVAGLLEELNDPYTTYLTPARFERLEERASGNYAGVGLRVDLRDGWPAVTSPIQGSPAERAGIAAGDRLLEIDGREVKGWTVEEVTRALRGEPGSSVAVLLERAGSAERMAVRLTRGEIHRRAVSRQMLLRDGVGYVDLNIFNDSTEHELRAAVRSLAELGMRSLVLDLRGNPGGVLAQGVAVAELFLDPRQTIVTMRGRTAEMNRAFSDAEPQLWRDLPLIVLIDARSASASEIVAGALQDHDRAVIMGTPSFGKGSAQSVFPLASGSGVRLTTARWFTPAGRSIDKLGIASRAAADAADEGEVVEDGARPAFKTDGGRVVYGGGGIFPDVHAFDSTFAAQEEELSAALGSQVPAFRDALGAYADDIKRRGNVRRSDFEVTPAMREEFWKLLRSRAVDLQRGVFDANVQFVQRLITSEIARIVFGAAAEARRSAERDLVVRQAVQLIAGVSRDELLARALAAPGAVSAAKR